MERTLVILKPGSLRRPGAAEDIIGRIKRRSGVRIGRRLITVPSVEQVRRHYAEHEGRDYFDRLVAGIAEQTIAVIILEGDGVVAWWRAEQGDFREENRVRGTIRGDWMQPGDPLDDNLTHGSDSVEAAKREIPVWFPDPDNERALSDEELGRWYASFSPEDHRRLNELVGLPFIPSS